MNAFGARRIALLSPYPPELADPEERFFAAAGFEVAAHTALALTDVREWPAIEPERWLRLAVEAGELGFGRLAIAKVKGLHHGQSMLSSESYVVGLVE